MGKGDRKSGHGRSGRALAKIEARASGGSQPILGADPITIGPNRQIIIDFTKLPPPNNVYDADFAWVEHSPGDVRFFFAKASRNDRDRLRTRLEVRYPPENLLGHFWKNSRSYHAVLREHASRWPAGIGKQTVRSDHLLADKDHSEWANFESIAHAGSEACLDFYLMPAPGIARFSKGQGSDALRLVSVVRVQLTIFELLHLLDATEDVVAAVEKYVPSITEPLAPQTEPKDDAD